MPQKKPDGLSALTFLQSRLDTSSHLEVLNEGAYHWKAYFSFALPAQKNQLEPIKKIWNLPSTYEEFLLHHNGALLYYDDVYGQWGYQFYNTEELITKNRQWQHIYEDDWSSAFLVFAESLGDSDLLLIDTQQPSPIDGECYIVDGDVAYPSSQWRRIAQSFGIWLDRLVVAQGAKYWRWY
jgi:phage pi2 protein 07